MSIPTDYNPLSVHNSSEVELKTQIVPAANPVRRAVAGVATSILIDPDKHLCSPHCTRRKAIILPILTSVFFMGVTALITLDILKKSQCGENANLFYP